MARAAAGTSTTASSDAGPGSSSAAAPKPTATSAATIRSGRSRLPARSDQKPLPSRPAAPSTCVSASRAPAAASGMAPPVCRTSTRKTEPRNCGTTSSSPPALRRCSRRSARTVEHPARGREPRAGASGGSRHARGHGHGREQADRGEREEHSRHPTGRGHGRQCDRGQRGPDRHRGLPHGHREAPAARGEPGHHRAPAGGVDRRPRGPGQHEQRAGGERVRDERRRGQRGGRADQPDRHDAALAEPVGGRAPWDEGGHEPDRDRADHQRRRRRGRGRSAPAAPA